MGWGSSTVAQLKWIHRIWSVLVFGGASIALFGVLSGCATAYLDSVGGGENQIYSRIYLTDIQTAWQATLDALKSHRLDVANRESGTLQTKWRENTADRNFVDSFGAADAYLQVQYRVKVQLSKGYYHGKASVKVTVEKEQLVKRDVLEGWRPGRSDSIEEQTLLYRVGRLIQMRMRLAQLEQERIKRALDKVDFK